MELLFLGNRAVGGEQIALLLQSHTRSHSQGEPHLAVSVQVHVPAVAAPAAYRADAVEEYCECSALTGIVMDGWMDVQCGIISFVFDDILRNVQVNKCYEEIIFLSLSFLLPNPSVQSLTTFSCLFPQESCRKCHVQWKQHVGKTCEQVLERDEIRMRVLL